MCLGIAARPLRIDSAIGLGWVRLQFGSVPVGPPVIVDAVVGQRGGGRVDLPVVLVRERLVGRRRRERVVRGAELLEGGRAVRRAEFLAQVLQQVGVLHLDAAALAEDAADQPGDRDDVGHRPLLRQGLRRGRGVVGRQQARVGRRGVDVAVHAVDVVVDQRTWPCSPCCAVLGRQRVDLRDGLRLRVRRDRAAGRGPSARTRTTSRGRPRACPRRSGAARPSGTAGPRPARSRRRRPSSGWCPRRCAGCRACRGRWCTPDSGASVRVMSPDRTPNDSSR